MSDFPNPAQYDIKSKAFWQTFFDRLTRYLSYTHTATILDVSFTATSDITIKCTNQASLYPLLQGLFQAKEKEGYIILPNSDIEGYPITKAIWLYVPNLFSDEENRLIMQSYVKFFFASTFPKLFTSRFLKHLNSIVDIQDTVRKAGIKSVEFSNQGVHFIWPIFFVSKQTAREILNTGIPGIEFVRDEIQQLEILTVNYQFAWAALSGTNWTGDLNALFEKANFYKNLYAHHFSNVDVDKYSYCADRIRANFNLNSGEYKKIGVEDASELDRSSESDS
jgi:hypothetical protein